MQTRIKNRTEIKAMRESGAMLAYVLNFLQKNLTLGMSTKDIAVLATDELNKIGGKPTFLGYQGFPDVICISLNNEIVHGIPSKSKIIEDGDIISLDFGVTYQGMITDGAITTIFGKTKNKKHQQLVDDTRKSLEAGITVVADGIRVGDISASIQKVLDHNHYGIIRDLVGHGVGHNLHEDPNIPNYGRAHTGPWLKAGMTIAIEPMAALGREDIIVDKDGWTILTADNSMSAHFEHTVLITDQGYEILTLNNLEK